MEAVFVGAALVATSVGITARVLASKGLLDERASKVILAAAFIDDVLGLLVLAVVSGVARAVSTSSNWASPRCWPSASRCCWQPGERAP